MNEAEMRQEIKDKLTEKRKLRETIAALKMKLHASKGQFYSLESTIRIKKELVGSFRGKNCPALKAKEPYLKRICLAKHFKYPTYNVNDMYASHCFYCKLTPAKAKVAMDYDVILNGKRKNI